MNKIKVSYLVTLFVLVFSFAIVIGQVATDSIYSHVTVVTKTTFIHGVQDVLTPMNWFLMFLGWVMYWLKSFNACRVASNGAPIITYTKVFWQNNFVEVPISAISCLVIALLSTSISTDFIDLHGTLTVFITGYTSSSILNSIITQSRTTLK